MVYKMGDVHIYNEKDHEANYGDDGVNSLYDDRHDVNIEFPVVRLPHSCGAWVIGTRHNVEVMIEDLKKILEKLPK